jgi:rare lipoprotein A (peptidoglycan hydrolase)
LGFTNRGTAWVRVEYVGPAPIAGSDDSMLEATLRQDEPAPAPGSTKLAATRIVPVSMTSYAPRNTQVASAVAADPSPAPAQAMSYALTPSAVSGADPFLNGRGLY